MQGDMDFKDSKPDSFYDHYNRDDTAPKKSDATVDAELRGRLMSGDPMLQYFKEKEREKLGTQGKPIYSHQYPPNRYNIRPGYRWDGVDRSNGYEKKLIESAAAKKANEEHSYRHATRDL